MPWCGQFNFQSAPILGNPYSPQQPPADTPGFPQVKKAANRGGTLCFQQIAQNVAATLRNQVCNADSSIIRSCFSHACIIHMRNAGWWQQHISMGRKQYGGTAPLTSTCNLWRSQNQRFSTPIGIVYVEKTECYTARDFRIERGACVCR